MSNALPLDGSHMDIVTLVEMDHQAIAALLARFDDTPPEAHEGLFVQLVHLLVAHEVAEEQAVFPALRPVTDEVEPMLQQRLREQAEIEQSLRRLEALGVAAAGFLPALDELRRSITSHAAAEEREVLPLITELEQVLDRPGMGARYTEAKHRAPSHPHPDAPDRPPANLIAGPVAGVVDRVRDAFR